MPARVHAILVTRTSATSLARLLRALDALSAQTLPPDALTIVSCGTSSALRSSPAVSAAAEAVVETRANAGLAAAVALAMPRVHEGSAVWLLTDDVVPDPRALEQLVGALERSPSAVAAAPKLIGVDENDRIISFGQSMTHLGRAVDPARGELDQGQHDAQDDALGADIRGLLLRAGTPLRPDTGLGGADEGLDLGVRARLAGGRFVLTAAARIGVDDGSDRAGTAGEAYAVRRAQLHRRLAYAPAAAVPMHWLSLLPLALWRSITHLVGKRPAAVFPEWGAALGAMASFGAVSRSRESIRANRAASWSSIAPLRFSRAQLRQRLDDGHGSEGGRAQELGFFSGGGAWTVLAALVVGIAAFVSLLAWPALGGGALLPLRDTVAGLWRDAAYGTRGFGVDVFGPADPFSGVVAIIGSLWPAAPSYALVLLWVLALPLAALGGWFAATRLTDRPALRIFGAVVWALAPSFLIALTQGRPAAVIAHLLLPWLFQAALVAHRSWGAAGAASLLAVGVLACAPSLAPAIALLWIIGIIVLLSRRSVRGAVRMLWVLIPTAVVFAPLVVWQAVHGSIWAVFADPGAIAVLPQASADAAGRLALATGLPVADGDGWAAMLHIASAPWVPFLFAPLALLALLAPVSPRWAAGIVSIVVAATGLATAFAAVGIVVSFSQSNAVAIWPGSGLSLAWIGVLGGALVTLDSALTLPVLRRTAAALAAGAIAVAAVPALTAVVRDASLVVKGADSTLPAYINAQARGDHEVGTLVLTAQRDGGVATTVVWGASSTLGAQSTMLTTATKPRGEDLAALSVDLISAREFDAPTALSELGVRYVLLDAATTSESDAARLRRLDATTALDQRAGFVRVGETARGTLWRMDAAPAPRATASLQERGIAQIVITAEIVVVLAALLLSIPTRASRRAARSMPRAVGLAPEREAGVGRERAKDAKALAKDARRAEKDARRRAGKPSAVIPVVEGETPTGEDVGRSEERTAAPVQDATETVAQAAASVPSAVEETPAEESAPAGAVPETDGAEPAEDGGAPAVEVAEGAKADVSEHAPTEPRAAAPAEAEEAVREADGSDVEVASDVPAADGTAEDERTEDSAPAPASPAVQDEAVDDGDSAAQSAPEEHGTGSAKVQEDER